MGLHQAKKLMHYKGNHQQSERYSQQNGRKMFANYAIDRGVVSGIYEQLKKLNNKTVQIRNGQRGE